MKARPVRSLQVWSTKPEPHSLLATCTRRGEQFLASASHPISDTRIRQERTREPTAGNLVRGAKSRLSASDPNFSRWSAIAAFPKAGIQNVSGHNGLAP